jgi:hypothetical protein
MLPQSTSRSCWLRAWQRAKEEKLIPYYTGGARWEVKDYTITVTGPGWSDLACTCLAGRNHLVCKHIAVTAKAIAVGVRPVRGTAKAIPAPVVTAALAVAA